LPEEETADDGRYAPRGTLEDHVSPHC
jgi:hypothetical protein